MLRIFHNTSGLTIRKVTDAQGSSAEVVLSPAEVWELIEYLNTIQVHSTAITYPLLEPDPMSPHYAPRR